MLYFEGLLFIVGGGAIIELGKAKLSSTAERRSCSFNDEKLGLVIGMMGAVFKVCRETNLDISYVNVCLCS